MPRAPRKRVEIGWIKSVADPGFPVGGHGPHGGMWIPEAVAFRKFCMSKRKSLDLRGACTEHSHPRSANGFFHKNPPEFRLTFGPLNLHKCAILALEQFTTYRQNESRFASSILNGKY